MTDIVTFLRARLDEDEEVARAAGREHADARDDGLRWGSHLGDVLVHGTPDRTIVVDPRGWPGSVDVAEHIVRHDPARVLADVEAKRRIVEETERGCDGEGEYSRCAEWSDSILRLLALPHADHKDYDEAWKVE